MKMLMKRMRIMSEKLYTVDEIKRAFINTFHNTGERWFGGSVNDCTCEWQDFRGYLRGTTSSRLSEEDKVGVLLALQADDDACDEPR